MQPDPGDLHVPQLATMPFQTEHAARQTDPDDYVRFRRKTLARGIDAVIGFKRDGGSEIQSLRFDAERFTAAEAKTWLKDHDFKTTLEAAKPAEKAAIGIATAVAMTTIAKKDELRYSLGIVYEPGEEDTQGEFATAEEIRKAHWAFAKRRHDLCKHGEVLLKALAADECVDIKIDCGELEKVAFLDDEHRQLEDDRALGVIIDDYQAAVDQEINGQRVKAGTWLIGVEWSPEMFAKIKRGERQGFSMYGRAERVKAEAAHA